MLRTSLNHPVHNRDTWTIDSIGRDGDLTVTGHTWPCQIPRHYVEEHVQLAYVQTSHAAQGRTVDTAILYLDTPTDTAGIYVPLTCGCNANHVYITAPDNAGTRRSLADVARGAMDRRTRPPSCAPPGTPTTTSHDESHPSAPAELSQLVERRQSLGQQIDEHTHDHVDAR